MSEIKVNSIKGVGASAAAITVNNTDGTCTANLSNRQNRNLIINGAMQVAQRGTSATGSAGNGYATVDRFQATQNGTDAYIEQHQVDVASGTTPYTLGFRKAFQVKNGNQTSGAGVTDKITIDYKFEAQDIANSGWNYTSSSSFITLSFWVKSSVAQNFFGRFQTIDGTNQNYPFETGSLSADTWTKVTKTIPGNSNIQIDNDVNHGFFLEFCMFRGTDRTGSVSLNAWAAYASGTRTPDQTSTWYTTDDATFEITGVQLEVGSVATDFEHKSFAVEERLCQRYFYKYTLTTCGLFISTPSSGYAYGFLRFPVPMRASPTIILRDDNGNDGAVTMHGAAHNIAATASAQNTNGLQRILKSSGTFTNGANLPIVCGISSATAEL
jgi:hypothetical protein